MFGFDITVYNTTLQDIETMPTTLMLGTARSVNYNLEQKEINPIPIRETFIRSKQIGTIAPGGQLKEMQRTKSEFLLEFVITQVPV